MNLEIGKEKRIAAAILVGFCGSFMLWALLATIESAAIAPGAIVVASNVKQIQHQEGGIVQFVGVEEGTRVAPGQVLMQLDDTQARTRVNILEEQLTGLQLVEARLTAELSDQQELSFDPELTRRLHSEDLREMQQTQMELFQSNQNRMQESLAILQNQVEQQNERLVSTSAQIESVADQQALIDEELASLQVLVEKQLVRKSRLLALQRERSRLEQVKQGLSGQIEETEQMLEELAGRIGFALEEERSRALNLLERTQVAIADNVSRLIATQDVLERTTIVSPAAGWVMGLSYHTSGEVIRPSEPIMTIVPELDRFIIEAQLSPNDIDMVQPGLKAKVTLTALNQRFLPNIEGTVEHISADVFRDERLGTSYYRVQISIPQDELVAEHSIQLTPGMPVQVMILNDKRSPMGYLLDPIRESFNRAFRED